MITWTRATWNHLCGACGRQIQPGHAMQIVTVAGVGKPFRRCVLCAEGVPPPDLPEFVAPAPRTKRMEPIGRVASRTVQALPFDYKQAAAGREPGEDG